MKRFHSLGIAFVALTLMIGCGKKKNRVKIEKEIEMMDNMEDIDLASIAPEEDFFDEAEALEDIEDFALANEENKNVESQDGAYWAQGPEASADQLFAYTPEVQEPESYAFKSMQFNYNSDKLRDDQMAVLHENIELAKRAIEEGRNIEVRAYRCQLGDAVINMGLSQRTANLVKKEMVKHGIPADRIVALGCGQDHPLVSTNASDRATRIKDLSPNRRVEISIS